MIPWWGDVSGTIYDDQSKYERVPITWEAHDNLKDFLQTGIITKLLSRLPARAKRPTTTSTVTFLIRKVRYPIQQYTPEA
mgnify:CR=1 FL=1